MMFESNGGAVGKGTEPSREVSKFSFGGIGRCGGEETGVCGMVHQEFLRGGWRLGGRMEHRSGDAQSGGSQSIHFRNEMELRGAF